MDRKAIEGGAFSGVGGGHGGRPDLELDDTEGSKGGAKLSSWLGRFTSSTKSQRRGSAGFDVGAAPLLRMDDDSNSGNGMDHLTSSPRNAGQSIPFGRKRDVSFSDIQTPGGDGDTFIMNYKRKSSIDYSRDYPDFDSPKHHHTPDIEHTSPHLQTIPEAKNQDNLKLKFEPSASKVQIKSAVESANSDSDDCDTKKEASSIFLIDIETASDGKNVKVVPKTKKFSMSDWAQNWFFRNESIVDDDNAQPGNDHGKGTSLDRVNDFLVINQEINQEDDTEREKKLSFTGRLKEMVIKDEPNRYREINAWQSQSQ